MSERLAPVGAEGRGRGVRPLEAPARAASPAQPRTATLPGEEGGQGVAVKIGWGGPGEGPSVLAVPARFSSPASAAELRKATLLFGGGEGEARR